MLIFFVFVVFLYIATINKIKELASTNSNYYQRTNSNVYNGYNQIAQAVPNKNNNQVPYQQAQVQKEYCTNCGTVLIGPFCTKCGKR